MAELAVSAAHVLVELLYPFLEQLDLKKDLSNDIRSMRSWLRSMKAFVEDNGGRGNSRTLEDKVEQIRDIAYEIEDVLEDFVRHSPHMLAHHHNITRTAHKLAHNIRHGFPLGRIPDKIDNIKKNIEDIKSQNAAFSAGCLNPGPGTSSSSSYHRVSPLLLDDEMVGYEDLKKRFSSQLINGEKGLLTLAVEGPGGSGKTTFVKNIFWTSRIRRQFDCHAWLHVPRKPDVKKLLVNMLTQFSGSKYNPSDDFLRVQEKLRNHLMRKRYIVVLDDIWREEDWKMIQSVFPNGSRGSRIIVTTRDSKLASVCASSGDSVYSLKNGLHSLEAFSLFCKKAFLNGACPPDLKDSSLKIVAFCEGLPFIIVAMGAALSQRPKLPYEWERFHQSLEYEIRNGSRLSSIIGNTLLPGYMDLPSNLKSCFLYFSVFPEDYSVERGRLVRLWVAEQFAVGSESKMAEEVAEDYLDELIHRNLVHVSKWDFYGRPRSCRVLNLVLKFIIHKCKDENFASIFCRENANASRKIRRLALHNADRTSLSQHTDVAGVRSLFLFRYDNTSSFDLDKDFRDIELLRVLDLQNAPLREFPQHISHQNLLRYLCLRDTKIRGIPKSIKKLLSLETLDLKQTDVEELPKEISQLHQLRHIFAYKYNVTHYIEFDSVRGVRIRDSISELTNLRDLCHVKVGQKGTIIKDLRGLKELRKLGLLGIKNEHCTGLCESLSRLKKLNTLYLTSFSKDEYLDLEKMESPPRSIQRLYLQGRMTRVPHWISSLDNLLRVGLKWSKMQDSPLTALGSLPNLMELQLVDCLDDGRGELVFEVSSFKKLKILLVEDFPMLHTLIIEHGSMPELRQMSLHKCPNLKMLPLGIDQMAKIEELILRDMAEDFIALMRRNREERSMVRHIPVIHSYTLISESWAFQNLSDFTPDSTSSF